MSSDTPIPYVSQWGSFTADNRPLTRTIRTTKESALERAATANKQWRISMAAKKKAAETSKTASKAGASEGLLKRYWENVTGSRRRKATSALDADLHYYVRDPSGRLRPKPEVDEAFAAQQATDRARIGTLAAVGVPTAATALVHHRRKKEKTAQVIPLLVGENAPTLQLPADPIVVGFDEELESILGYWEHWGKTAARKDETKLPDPVQTIKPPKGLPAPPKDTLPKLSPHASLKVRPAWKPTNLMKTAAIKRFTAKKEKQRPQKAILELKPTPRGLGIHAKRTGEDHRGSAYTHEVPTAAAAGFAAAATTTGITGKSVKAVAASVREYLKKHKNTKLIDLPNKNRYDGSPFEGPRRKNVTAISNKLKQYARSQWERGEAATVGEVEELVKKRLKGAAKSGLGGGAVVGGLAALYNVGTYHGSKALAAHPSKTKK